MPGINARTIDQDRRREESVKRAAEYRNKFREMVKVDKKQTDKDKS